MSIRRNRNATSTAVLEQPAPQPMEAIAHPRIEVRTPTEMNGYLDPDQTLVNFAVRELGMSFKQLIAEDPSRLLRNWLKCYKTARGTAIGTLGLGTAALIVGVGVGAWPLSVAGGLTMGVCGLLVKHHNSGVKACELEAEIIDEIRPVLELFHALETRGANPSDLVSLYDRLIRQYAVQNPAFGLIGDPKHLKDFFETELAKHQTISAAFSTPTGLVTASTIPVVQPAIAPSAPEPSPLPAPEPEPVAEQPEPQQPAIASPISSILSGTPESTPEPQAEAVAAATPPEPPKALPTNTRELLERLKVECPTLLKLVKSPPIRLVGDQRTGKSTFARILVCLRMLFIPKHQAAYATPHAEEDNPVPQQFNPFGFNNGKDFEAIERFWVGVQKSINAGKNLNLSIVWDEFGDYDKFKDHEPLGEGLRSLLRESSKHQYYPILIAHGDQASFYPGVRGILSTLKSSTVKVETIGEAVNYFGEMAPTGRATVTWLNETTENLKLPSWLTVEFLLSLLPPVASASPVVPTIATEEPKKQPIAEATVTEESDEDYLMKEAESTKEEEAIARVRGRVFSKLHEANGEWLSISKLTQDFRADDRSSVRRLIRMAVGVGILQYEERENPNGTKSGFVRIASQIS